MPGYALFRSLTQRLAGKDDQENVWKPALAEIEEALVPAFIIEELADGRFTVFVPSVPTPSPAPFTYSLRNGCIPSMSLHTGDQVYLAVGIRFKRTCRSNETKSTLKYERIIFVRRVKNTR